MVGMRDPGGLFRRCGGRGGISAPGGLLLVGGGLLLGLRLLNFLLAGGALLLHLLLARLGFGRLLLPPGFGCLGGTLLLHLLLAGCCLFLRPRRDRLLLFLDLSLTRGHFGLLLCTDCLRLLLLLHLLLAGRRFGLLLRADCLGLALLLQLLLAGRFGGLLRPGCLSRGVGGRGLRLHAAGRAGLPAGEDTGRDRIAVANRRIHRGFGIGRS